METPDKTMIYKSLIPSRLWIFSFRSNFVPRGFSVSKIEMRNKTVENSGSCNLKFSNSELQPVMNKMILKNWENQENQENIF